MDNYFDILIYTHDQGIVCMTIADEGFYCREDPPHYATKVQSLFSLNESFPLEWIKPKGAIDYWLACSVAWSATNVFFSVFTVKYIAYARNLTAMIKMVHKRCLSWNWQWQTTIQRCVHECVVCIHVSKNVSTMNGVNLST